MPNVLILDKTDEDIAEALSGCKVGQPKQLTLTVIPTVDDDRTFKADVTEVEYSEPGDNATEEETESGLEPAAEPTAPKGKMSPAAGRQSEAGY